MVISSHGGLSRASATSAVYVVHLPWGTKRLDSRDSLALFSESWQALKPLLETVRDNARSRRK